MWLDNLKTMKEQSGMTTKEISVNSGIPEPTLEKLFAGVTKDPRLGTMQQLVHFFGYTLDDLDDKPLESKKSSSAAVSTPEDPLRSILLHNFDQLNQEGQERLVETSDDMVSSRKYIKSDPAKLGKTKGA